jgi:hypothetical protein
MSASAAISNMQKIVRRPIRLQSAITRSFPRDRVGTRGALIFSSSFEAAGINI